MHYLYKACMYIDAVQYGTYANLIETLSQFYLTQFKNDDNILHKYFNC